MVQEHFGQGEHVRVEERAGDAKGGEAVAEGGEDAGVEAAAVDLGELGVLGEDLLDGWGG